MQNFSSNRELKKTASNIGIALLIFIGMFSTFFYGIYYSLTDIFYEIAPENIAYALSEISFGLIYLTVFIVPALVLRLLSRKNTAPAIKKVPPTRKATPLYIFLATSIGFTCSYITTMVFSLLGILDKVMPSQPTSEPMAFYQILLSAFTTAIVPAICEEFLFRSTILSKLLPFGEGFAIVSSALLFGLMHQTLIQIFYTTMAGIIIGYAYVKTRSYLCVFLIHFSNNFIGVIQEAVSSNVTEPLTSTIILLIESIVFSLGIVCVIILAIKEKSKKSIYSRGCYQNIDQPSPNFRERTVSINPFKQLFSSPTVLIFTIISLITIILPLILPTT